MKKISFILTLILFIQTSLIAEEITYQEILENPTDLELNLNFAKQQENTGNLKLVISTLERLNMSGKFDNQKGKLELNHFSVNIGEEEVKGFFTIEQFNKPLVSCDIKGGADLEKLSKFFPDIGLTIKGEAKFFFIADVEFDQNKM